MDLTVAKQWYRVTQASLYSGDRAMIIDLISEVERLQSLETKMGSGWALVEAEKMQAQNAALSHKLEEAQAQLCGMRAALKAIASTEDGNFREMRRWCEKHDLYIDDLSDERAWIAVAKKALSAFPPCLHKAALKAKEKELIKLHTYQGWLQEQYDVACSANKAKEEEIGKLKKVVEIAQEVEILTRCQCDNAFTSRGRHESNALCEENLVLAQALADLEGKNG